MNAERSRPPEIGYSSLQELAGDATQSHNTGLSFKMSNEQDPLPNGLLPSPRENGPSGSLNQYRMRLPRQFTNGISPDSAGSANNATPTVRKVSGADGSTTRNAPATFGSNSSNAQVKNLVARFNSGTDGDAVYAPRSYSRTTSSNSANAGFRPSGASSRSTSTTREDSGYSQSFSATQQRQARSPDETTYKPYRAADAYHLGDSQKFSEGYSTRQGATRTTSRDGSEASSSSQARAVDSLLSVPGNLSSRHRAVPGEPRPLKPGYGGARSYSSDQAFSPADSTAFSNAGNGQTLPQATMPSNTSPKSRLPIRTHHSATTSRRGSFNQDQGINRKRSQTPPAQTNPGLDEVTVGLRSSSLQRLQTQLPRTTSSVVTPTRTARSAGNAGASPSSSPHQPSTRTIHGERDTYPDARPGLNSRSPSEKQNLLTQLSNAVSPPRLRLELPDPEILSNTGPKSAITEFQEDDFNLHLPGQHLASVPGSANHSARQSASARGYSDKDAYGYNRSLPHAQSGREELPSLEPEENTANVLDRIMNLRQRSNQLLTDVFSASTNSGMSSPSRHSHNTEPSHLGGRLLNPDVVEDGRPRTASSLPGQRSFYNVEPERAASPGPYAGMVTPPRRTLSPGARSTQTGRLTLDSDSYSVINKVLDQYHETGVVSPQMVYTFQQHILETDPELSGRDDIDSLSIAKAALEDLVKDHSQSSLFQVHSQSSLFAGSPARSSPYRAVRALHEHGDPSVDHLGIRTLHQSERDQGTYLESPTLPGSDIASAQRLKHHSNANQLVPSAYQTDAIAANRDSQDIGPTPPPKDYDYAGANRPDRQTNGSLMRDGRYQQSNGNGPMLPEIQATGGGLGFHLRSRSSGTTNDTGHLPKKYGSPVHDAGSFMDTGLEPRPRTGPVAAHSIRDKPSTTPQTSTPPQEQSRSFSTKPSVELSGNDRSTTASFNQEARSGESLNEVETRTSTATSSGPEDARLVKRRHIIKELVDTEFSFNQDMKVIEDIYKGTASAVESLTTDDRRILFGNSAQIVEFSEAFLDTLKQAAASVYVMPRTNKWRIKRGSMTVEPNEGPESVLVNVEGTDEERDRKTFIVEAFGQYLSRIEKVYGDYLRNHDLANQRLARLQTIPQVNLWLNECHTYASDITSAWDLDSLLVKPVQRVLKYPLLLKSLLEATPADHPDYSALEVAMKQMTDASFRINESKKRAEILDQAVKGPNKKKDFDMSSGISRAFGRRSDKLRQQVGMADAVEDFEYKAIAEKFGGQLFQLQVVMRDMEMYKKSVEDFIRQYSRITEVIETMIELGPSTAPKTESKWRKFTMTIREMTAIIYVDHDNAIKKHCIDPIIALIKLHEKPQSLMAQRKKRLPEYAKFVLIKNQGGKPDKKTQQQGEQFIALNDTLKDELPKLFALNAKLVETCLKNYVDIQVQWQLNWQRKIGNILKEQQMPADFDAIVETFHNDFSYTEAQVLALSICNGQYLADAAALRSPTASTLIGTDDASSIKRPSLMASQRSESMTSSPVIPEPEFLKHRSQSSFQLSIHSNRASVEPGPRSPSINSSQTPLSSSVLNSFPPSTAANKRRHRSGSATSSIHGRSPLTPTLPNLSRNSSAQTVAFGPYQPTDRIARPSNPGPASPLRSPTASRFSQNSATSVQLSPVATRQPAASLYNAAASPYSAISPTTSRSSAVFQDQARSSTSSQPDPTVRPSRPTRSRQPTAQATTTVQTASGPQEFPVLFLAASLFEFNIDRSRKEAGYPYLTYVPGEIFDVIGEKGELWLAKNQDDATGLVGWIWEKHFAKLVPDANGAVAARTSGGSGA